MIEKEAFYILSCDTCGDQHEWHLLPRAAMIRAARDNGWGIRLGRGSKVLNVACPEHNDFDNGE